jgi:hypothetical protein
MAQISLIKYTQPPNTLGAQGNELRVKIVGKMAKEFIQLSHRKNMERTKTEGFKAHGKSTVPWHQWLQVKS